MKFTKKRYFIVLFSSFFTSAMIHADETIHTSFKPNKRHMHEKKEVKKETVTEKKSSHHAARIHKKPAEKSTKVKRTTTIARHHKNTEEKQETFFQKTWGTIKAFFSGKKTE